MSDADSIWADADPALALLRELASRGATQDEVAGLLAHTLGVLCAGMDTPEASVAAAKSIVAAVAGAEPDASLALLMPCRACWDSLVVGIAERELTGSATQHCAHRALGFVIHAEGGTVRRWSVGPMTPEQVQERRRS
ncbi:MAG: hypothetical protein L0H73_13665, partial [Nitrococcus sp.]|nr:hypothetical protein [Nitrococcus sp.]